MRIDRALAQSLNELRTATERGYTDTARQYLMQAQGEVSQLQREYDTIARVLRELEWDGHDEYGGKCCPSCFEPWSQALAYRGEPQKHAADCDLDRVLGKIEGRA